MILLSFTLEIEIWCTKCVATLIPRVCLVPGELHPGPVHAVRLSSGILYFSMLRYQAKPICLTKHMFYILHSPALARSLGSGEGGFVRSPSCPHSCMSLGASVRHSWISQYWHLKAWGSLGNKTKAEELHPDWGHKNNFPAPLPSPLRIMETPELQPGENR